MHSFEFPRLRRSTAVAILLLLLFAFHLQDDYTHITPLYWQTARLKGARLWDAQPIEPAWEWNVTTDANNLLLTHRHCEQAFHGLFKPIDQSVRRHTAIHNRIQLGELDNVSGLKGVVRAMIFNQRLYIISTGGTISSRSFMVLSQIYRAVVTSPEEVPNIEFTFTSDDRPAQRPKSTSVPKQWAFARTPDDHKTWLMPEFGYFSWPETGLESFHDVRRKAEDIDTRLDWEEKQSTLLWRGRTTGVAQHADFLDATSNAPWADVQAVGSPRPGDSPNLFDMDEHCNSKYLAHTESKSYNGRLKYLQLCKSVVITEPPKWTSYHSHLMQKDGPYQNYLEVKKDWSDLEDKIKHLQSWDSLGERIAKNSVEAFRERYLTPAAEVCSWRRLFKGWAEVSAFEPEMYDVDENGRKTERGVPYERYLMGTVAE